MCESKIPPRKVRGWKTKGSEVEKRSGRDEESGEVDGIETQVLQDSEHCRRRINDVKEYNLPVASLLDLRWCMVERCDINGTCLKTLFDFH